MEGILDLCVSGFLCPARLLWLEQGVLVNGGKWRFRRAGGRLSSYVCSLQHDNEDMGGTCRACTHRPPPRALTTVG